MPLSDQRDSGHPLLDLSFGLETFDNCIMEPRPNLLNCLVTAIGPGSVRQQRERQGAVGIDPKRCARIAQMAVRVRGEELSGL